MLIHGTADRLSPIDGGYSRHRGPNGELRGRTLSLQETVERWRAIRAELITQEFDAAEEICRFAEPLIACADTRRL
jgi:hypothetical protein